VAPRGISRLRYNGRPFDYRVRADAEALTQTLTEAMTSGSPVVLALADKKGKPGGTLVINGSALTDFVVNGVPPMDGP
jgi:hypothetical protein